MNRPFSATMLLEEGVLLQTVAAFPIEIYTPERKAQFLLTNAIDREDYLSARQDVEIMRLDPDNISHQSPT